MSIYEQAKELGLEMDNHESDLYLRMTPQSTDLMRTYAYRANVTTFISQIDKKPWYDIPFAYTPFWDKRTEKKVIA